MDELTALLVAARDGDRLALAAWVRRTQAEVWRLCAHLVDAEQADDLTQEVYLRAHQALGRFRAEASARTWLLSITRRTCADAIRAAQRRRRLAATRPPRLVSPDHAPGHAVADLLTGLDHDQRVAFVLTQLLGLTYAEAAAVCECPVGTVRSRVARARERLVAALAEDPAAGER